MSANRGFHPRALLLQWHITERCNLRCSHCYQESFAGRELDLDALLFILHQFLDLLSHLSSTSQGPLVRGHISLTGGEPFIRADLMDLLQAVARESDRLSFAVLSNGALLDRTLSKELARLSPAFVQVSVEGRSDSHDRIRGLGAHDRAVHALKRLGREGIATMVAFTAHRGNYMEFCDVARMACRLGVKRVWADRFIPLGSGSDRLDPLTPAETLELFQLMHRARMESQRTWFCRTEVAMHRALQFLLGGGRPYRCTAGESLITILPDGSLVPCRRMPLPAGNVMETPLKVLYEESPALRALRAPRKVSHGCGRCRFAPQCRGGLRCLAYALTGDAFSGDPGCWLAEELQGPSTKSAVNAVSQQSR